MNKEDLITLEELCGFYNVEDSFIQSLGETGLIEIVIIEDTPAIEKARVGEFEKMVHLHYDLGINPEGIDAIRHLLKRMDELQDEIKTLRNRVGM